MANFGGQESGLPDFGSTWAPNCCHQVKFPWNLMGMTVQMGYMQGGWHQNFCSLPEKKNIFVPNIAIFAPKYAFLCTHRPCRLIWYPVGWLVGGFGAKAALWIECLPSLLYFNFPAYYNLALCCWLLLCILKAFMVLKISQGLCSLYFCFLKPSLVL